MMRVTSEARLLIASDHAGFALKTKLIERRAGLPWQDLGPSTDARVDYPVFADRLALALEKAGPKTQPELLLGRESALCAPDGSLRETCGVLICGSGQGMAMRANRHPGLRAALCGDEEAARLARGHNDANVLCLGARLTTPDLALAILDAFLRQAFEGGRHGPRVALLSRPV